MNYQKEPKAALIKRIQELESLLAEIVKEKEGEDRLNFAWTGNLGRWYWNCQTNKMKYNPLKLVALGYSEEEAPVEVSLEFFTSKLHPDDYTKAAAAMRDHLSGKMPVYEIEYRILTKNGDWKWFYEIGKVTLKDDYGKPVMLSGVVFDITSRKELELQLAEKNRILEQLAITDGLTHLLNHRAVYHYLKKEIKRANRYHHDLSVMLMDVDNFKKVNDQMAYAKGDKVLKMVSQSIQACIRDIDTAGRYGGDEFLVIFPNSKLERAFIASERIRKSIEKLSIEGCGNITVSAGVLTYKGETVEELIEKTNQLLFAAKQKGKNQVVIALDS